MKRFLQQFIVVVVVIFSIPAVSLAQLSPDQPTAEPTDIPQPTEPTLPTPSPSPTPLPVFEVNAEGWIGSWIYPLEVRQNEISLEETGILSFTIEGEYFSANLADADPLVAESLLYSYTSVLPNLVFSDAVETSYSQIGAAVALDETGNSVIFKDEAHSWVMFISQGNRIYYREWWRLSNGHILALHVSGLSAGSFNTYYEEFKSIRDGITLIEGEFPREEGPFADA